MAVMFKGAVQSYKYVSSVTVLGLGQRDNLLLAVRRDCAQRGVGRTETSTLPVIYVNIYC